MSYEFSPEQSARIAKLAWRVRTWGILALVFGLLGILGFATIWIILGAMGWSHGGLILTSTIAMAPVVLVNAIIAILYIGAGKALREIVDTQHNDVPHLMEGLTRLSGAFRIETILGSIGVITGAITLFTLLSGGG